MKWKVTIKEYGSDHTIETEYIGNVSYKEVVAWYGLTDPDVEWYEITKEE